MFAAHPHNGSKIENEPQNKFLIDPLVCERLILYEGVYIGFVIWGNMYFRPLWNMHVYRHKEYRPIAAFVWALLNF